MKPPNANLPPRLPALCLFLALSLTLLTACTSASPSTPPPPSAPALPTSTKTPLILPATWTPAPPTETPLPPTPRPTHTTTPTNTPAPTLPPSPTTFPPVRIATTDQHPFPNFNLIFLEGGILRRWSNNTSLVEDLIPLEAGLVDRVTQFATSPDGTRLVLLHRTASGQPEMILYSFPSRTIVWTLPINTSQATHLRLSSDNLFVAYAWAGTSTNPGGVAVIPVLNPTEPLVVGACKPACDGLLFLPGGVRLFWSDETGIWAVDPALGTSQVPEMILEPPAEGLAADGTPLTGSYTFMSFSPSGRYMLLTKGAVPESFPLVFDRQTRRVAEIPGSYLYTAPGLNVTWLAEDRLAVTRAGLATANQSRPAVEVWEMAPHTEAMMLRLFSTSLGNSPAQAPFVPAQLFNGGVYFAMFDFSTPNYSPGNGIYIFDPTDRDMVKLNDLPFLRIRQALWLPDTSGVLLMTANKVFYVPTNGAPIYEMDAFLGVSACCFDWVP